MLALRLRGPADLMTLLHKHYDDFRHESSGKCFKMFLKIEDVFENVWQLVFDIWNPSQECRMRFCLLTSGCPVYPREQNWNGSVGRRCFKRSLQRLSSLAWHTSQGQPLNLFPAQCYSFFFQPIWIFYLMLFCAVVCGCNFLSGLCKESCQRSYNQSKGQDNWPCLFFYFWCVTWCNLILMKLKEYMYRCMPVVALIP